MCCVKFDMIAVTAVKSSRSTSTRRRQHTINKYLSIESNILSKNMFAVNNVNIRCYRGIGNDSNDCYGDNDNAVSATLDTRDTITLVNEMVPVDTSMNKISRDKDKDNPEK